MKLRCPRDLVIAEGSSCATELGKRGSSPYGLVSTSRLGASRTKIPTALFSPTHVQANTGAQLNPQNRDELRVRSQIRVT